MEGLSCKVYVLILNWNGWQDTIECLESVFRLDYPSYRVIVCDNGSEDGSLQHIKAWAEGRLAVALPKDNPLRHLSFPPVPKPIPYVDYERSVAEEGGDPKDADNLLILIQTGSNLGFAGGNNVGLRYALARDDFDYVWLLNNDTVVRPDALTHLVRRMVEKPEAGMCGATVLCYDRPELVQSLGGCIYNKWLGACKPIGLLQSSKLPIDRQLVEKRMSYVAGSSLLVKKSFLGDIGLMSEDYFLYYEELDWAVRARGRYKLAYAPESIVYHEEGGTSGAERRKPEARDFTADYYSIRNRLIITRKYFRYALPVVYLGLVGAMGNRIRRRQWNRLGMILKLGLSR